MAKIKVNQMAKTKNLHTLGLYIHIPFCVKKCDYCDFLSFSCSNSAQKSYLQALKNEIVILGSKHAKNIVDSIFIGGGTPSAVYDGFIGELCNCLKQNFNLSPNLEFTIEVNPHTFTQSKLNEYIKGGITRISMGVQSINNKVLKSVGRLQTKSDVKNAFKILKQNHFENVNADIIIGLPNQTERSVIKTAKYLLKQKVPHISAYGLQLEENTPLYKRVSQHEISVAPDDIVAKTYNKLAHLLNKHGIKRYEVSNFARAGFECRHNQKYWFGQNYLGIGLGASGYIDNTRYKNTSDMKTYISTMQSTQSNLPIESSEELSKSDKRTEYIMLHLRTQQGIDLAEFNNLFNENLLQTKKNEINQLTKLGKITLKNNMLKINDAEFYLSNAIILMLV